MEVSKRTLLALLAGGALLASVLAAYAFMDFFKDANEFKLVTVDQGQHSDYEHGNDASFDGGCLTIRGQFEWEAFWRVHTARKSPQPPLPEVEFDNEMVLACFLGLSPVVGPHIEIVHAEVTDDGLQVSVDRNYTRGDIPAFTNPYHIVRVPDTGDPSLFLDNATGELIPTLTFVP